MILLFLSLFSHANNTYEIDSAIVGTKPADLDRVASIGTGASFDVAPNEPDVVVPSDWSYIECGVRNGHVYYEFTATDDDWPSSFPQQVTCQHGGYTLKINLVPRELSWDVPPRNLTLASGVSVDYPDVAGRAAGGMQTFHLPSGDYDELPWTLAEASVGGDWDGVKCRMAFAPNGPKFQVFVDPDADAGTGSCVLPNPSGPDHQIPVEVTR